MDAHGIESLCFRPVWTAVDVCGHRLENYGSEGWGVRDPPGVPRSPFTAKVSSTRSPRSCIGLFLCHLVGVDDEGDEFIADVTVSHESLIDQWSNNERMLEFELI